MRGREVKQTKRADDDWALADHALGLIDEANFDITQAKFNKPHLEALVRALEVGKGVGKKADL